MLARELEPEIVLMFDSWLGGAKILSPIQFAFDCRLDKTKALLAFALACQPEVGVLDAQYRVECPNCRGNTYIISSNTAHCPKCGNKGSFEGIRARFAYATTKKKGEMRMGITESRQAKEVLENLFKQWDVEVTEKELFETTMLHARKGDKEYILYTLYSSIDWWGASGDVIKSLNQHYYDKFFVVLIDQNDNYVFLGPSEIEQIKRSSNGKYYIDKDHPVLEKYRISYANTDTLISSMFD
jgi:predicted RNA-binding Zn-ribbon protein involved in translation (DUF1610 family)